MNLIRPAAIPNLEPRYNVAPTTDIDVIDRSEHGRTLGKMRWGLVPSWSKQMPKKSPIINARSETVAKLNTFRTPWKRSQRCIVPFNFFEWQKADGGKRPFYIHPSESYPAGLGFFCLAAIWDRWRDRENDRDLFSCAILTTEPNDELRPIHNRMPVIVAQHQIDPWFSAEPDAALDMLGPCPDDWVTAYEVSDYVNKVANQGPQCIEPV